MKVRCFYFLHLIVHIIIILVNEDSCDEWVAGDVSDKLWVIWELAFSGNGIVVSHGRVREGSIKFYQEVSSFYHEAYVDKEQPKFAVVLLGELDGVLFDSAERLECLLLAQVREHLDFDDAKSVLVLKLLLDFLGVCLCIFILL